MKLRSKSSIYSIQKVFSENERATVCTAYRKNKDYPWIRQKVLLKIFKKNSQQYPLELDSILQIRSPYCVSILNFESIEDRPALILEWCDSLNLFQLIRQTSKLNALEVSYICLQVQKGIVDLNQQGTCHGDLSLSNILIDRKGNILLIDFGKANYMGDDIFTTSYFTAPELFQRETPNFYSDLYSLGVLEKILNENHRSFEKGHSFAQEGDFLLDPIPQKRRMKEFINYKKAKESLALKVNSILSQQTLKDLRLSKPKRYRLRIPYIVLLVSFILMTAIGSGMRSSYGSIQVRSHKWMHIQLQDKSGFTPFESGPLTLGKYELKWRTQDQKGSKTIYIKENSHLLLTEKDFL